MNSASLAFILSAAAGLATGLGGLAALFAKRTNLRFLSASLGFSAGVMVYVSFVELLPAAAEVFLTNGNSGGGAASAAFFGGMLAAALIGRLFPSARLDAKPLENAESGGGSGLMRTGLVTALAICAHNLPEGMATFVSAMRDPSASLPIVFAVAIHNIPEGIAVAAPIYYATGSRGRAFAYAMASGLAEPVGALAAYFLLAPLLGGTALGALYAAVAGIMVYISLDELIPSALAHGDRRLVVCGITAGMLVMAASLAALS